MRALLIGLLLLSTSTLAGCVGGDGTIGLCVGPETPTKVLSDDLCKTWVIEIDHVTDQAPDNAAINLMKSRMSEMARKDAISVVIDQTNLQGDTSWTTTELANLEQATRDRLTGGNTITTHVLYVDGELAGKPDVLGFAHGSGYIVMFKDVMRQSTAPITVKTTASQMEQAALVHEFGHIIGLVGRIPMENNHEDDENAGHSDNPNSVMYWAIGTTSQLDLFGSGAPPTQFDSDDKADTCAAGGKC